ncbi:MAG: cobalamin biosynthesis protein, partial [Candidatus Methanomethylophilaceae archaeon]|nr:cobalamin biosynthesis protein [Candidatus Methanomethylophilaceae archaeon]
DTDPEKLKGFVLRMLEKEGIAKERIAAICSIDLKKDEEAILSFARFVRSPAMFYTSEQLMSLEGEFSKSEFVKSVTTVDCVCERSAMIPYGGELILKKTAENGMTLAICKRRLDVRFP